jgi:hypothetical protein
MAKLAIMQANGLLEIKEIFAAKLEGEDRHFLPRWASEGATALTAEVGLLALVPSPLNANRALAVCNSIHGRGVYGAVQGRTGTELHDGNERYIAANRSDAQSFASQLVVQVINHKAMTLDFSNPGVNLYKRAEDAA